MGLFATDPVRSCTGRGAQFLPKYYNEARTHLSLHKDAPIARAVQQVARMSEAKSGISRLNARPPPAGVRHSLAARRSDLWTMAGGRSPDIAIARRRRA